METGVLVHTDVDAITDTITAVGTVPEKYPNVCIARAKQFDILYFAKLLKHAVISDPHAPDT